MAKTMFRREFLNGLAGIVLTGALALPGFSAEPKTKPALETLAKQGLPEEFKRMGFTLGEYAKRDSDREIIILAEKHDAKNLDVKKRKIIKFLINEYKADSVGAETLSGEHAYEKTGFSPLTWFNNIERDIFLSGNKKTFAYGLSSPQVREDTINLDSIEHLLLSNIHDYNFAKKTLEELKTKDLTKKDIIQDILNELKKYKPFKKAQEKDKAIEKIKKLGFLPEDIKELCLRCIREEKVEDNDFLKFWGYNWNYVFDFRNKDFAENIKKYLTDSCIGIINVGSAHTQTDIIGITNLQDLIPYSYLIVYCPETDKEKIKNYLLEVSPENSRGFLEKRKLEMIKEIEKKILMKNKSKNKS